MKPDPYLQKAYLHILDIHKNGVGGDHQGSIAT
jgi:hypothetical protein